MHIYAKGLIALVLAAYVQGCGSPVGFSDKRGRNARDSSDAVGVQGVPATEEALPGDQAGGGSDGATVEVVPEGTPTGAGDGGGGADAGPAADDDSMSTADEGGTPSGSGSASGTPSGGTPTGATTPNGTPAPAEPAPTAPSVTPAPGETAPAVTPPAGETPASTTPPGGTASTPPGNSGVSPLDRATDEEAAACKAEAGGKGRVHFVSETGNQVITADSVAVVKVTGNQSKFTLTVKGTGEGLIALCLFVTGNRSNVIVDLQTSVDSLIVKRRGNKATVAVTAPAGVTIGKVVDDVRGNNDGVVAITGDGTYPR